MERAIETEDWDDLGQGHKLSGCEMQVFAFSATVAIGVLPVVFLLSLKR